MKRHNARIKGFMLIFRANPILSTLEGVSYIGGAIITGVSPYIWEKYLHV